jgi:lysophospholipase L1-like esterase
MFGRVPGHALRTLSVLLGGLAALGLITGRGIGADDKEKTKASDPMKAAREFLALPPRPARPALPPSKLPLEFLDGERIALVGNSTAERMNLFGHFETLLHQRFPDKKLVVRNFGRPADEVANRQRANDYTKLDDPVAAFGADTYVLFFGFNESFAGPSGVAKFQGDYERLIDELTKKYPRDDTKAPPRFVIVSPIAVEATGDPHMPDAEAQNRDLALYAEACKAVAAKRHIAYADLFLPTGEAFAAAPGLQYTINGCHVNEAGDRLVAERLDQAFFGGPVAKPLPSDAFAKLRAAVNDKSWVHLQDYRMVNGWYVYGGRRTWDTETFPREYVKLRNMAAVRDRFVWDIAAGRPVADRPDDTQTGELIVPTTRFGEPRQGYSESQDRGPTILPPADLIKSCAVPPGFEMSLFADEKAFPEIAKPVQLAFDSKGRLWISTMPSYPQWKPGDPPPSDKLVILEDTNKDGTADKSTVFYDKLHCPTGFQFFDGGVLVMDQPRMLWLKDTDGDDKADVVVHVLDGWATEDTHHTAGAFEASPGGLLHMLEGVAMSTTLETPWGPFRNFGSSGAYVLDPRTWKIRHFVTPGYGNPWCYVFNEWGQGICGDGTGAAQHWDTPLSGAQYRGRKGMNAVFNQEGMRPVVGSEYLRTRQFPDDVQDQFLYACVINTNGMPRWTISDDGAGYKGERVRHDPKDPKTAFDLIKSTDKHFRPVDPQIGPDGALWFGDWANPLIGHMQYSQRDPNRDHVHGRIYRLVYKDKPLLTPETQAGKSTREVLDQLKSPEWRTRYRARADLQARPKAEVLAAAQQWLGTIGSDPAADRLRTEVLWLQQSFHAVVPGGGRGRFVGVAGGGDARRPGRGHPRGGRRTGVSRGGGAAPRDQGHRRASARAGGGGARPEFLPDPRGDGRRGGRGERDTGRPLRGLHVRRRARGQSRRLEGGACRGRVRREGIAGGQDHRQRAGPGEEGPGDPAVPLRAHEQGAAAGGGAQQGHAGAFRHEGGQRRQRQGRLPPCLRGLPQGVWRGGGHGARHDGRRQAAELLQARRVDHRSQCRHRRQVPLHLGAHQRRPEHRGPARERDARRAGDLRRQGEEDRQGGRRGRTDQAPPEQHARGPGGDAVAERVSRRDRVPEDVEVVTHRGFHVASLCAPHGGRVGRRLPVPRRHRTRRSTGHPGG